jgi:hypothetical protein
MLMNMAILLSNMVPITYELVLFFPNTEESCISLYHTERENGPYILPTHARTIHEKVGNTLQHNYSKNTFNDQTRQKSSHPMSMKFLSSGYAPKLILISKVTQKLTNKR